MTSPEAKDPLGAAITRYFQPVVSRDRFRRWTGRSFVRICDNLVQYMGFQLSAYGSKDFCVNYCTVPLFLPHEFFGWICGGRFPRGKSHDGWWKSKNQAFANESMQDVARKYEEQALPWFDATATVEGFLRELEASRPSANVHIEFNYACCLAWLSRDCEAICCLSTARAGYESSHRDMPECEWTARYVHHCDDLKRAIDGGFGRRCLNEWRDASVATLKLTRILVG